MGLRLDRAGVCVVADMKIEAGKYYRTRYGDVVGPMRRTTDQSWYSNYRTWNEDGGIFSSGAAHGLDLISEVYVSDTPPETAPAPEAKTLRDEFAMEAMKLLLPKHDWVEGILALYSYKQADAMMEARKK
jgi:hypothetical protein